MKDTVPSRSRINSVLESVLSTNYLYVLLILSLLDFLVVFHSSEEGRLDLFY